MIIDMVLPMLNTTREVSSHEAGEQGDFAADIASLLVLMPAAPAAAFEESEKPLTDNLDNDTAAIPVPVNTLELLAPSLPLQAAPNFLSATEPEPEPESEPEIVALQETVDIEPLNTLFAAASGTAQDTAAASLASLSSQVQQARSIVSQERDNRLTRMLNQQPNDISVSDKQPLNLAVSEFKETSAQFSLAEGVDEPVVSRDMPALEKTAALLPGNIDTASTRALLKPETSVTLPQTVGTPEWQKSLGQQIVLFSRDGVQHAELRLHPEELGPIQVSMRLSSERMQIHFIADNLLTRHALENAVPALRHSLAESGIHLGQSSVGADTHAPSSNAFNGEKRADSQQRHGEEEGSDIFDEAEQQQATTSLTYYRSGINTFV